MTSDTVRIGMRVQIDNTWARVYRRPGTAVEGVLVAISPTGAVVTVRLDSLADSYVRVEHVKPALPSPPYFGERHFSPEALESSEPAPGAGSASTATGIRTAERKPPDRSFRVPTLICLPL
jgi:hypothetical protein